MPVHTYGPQEGLPELPVGMGEQMPTLPVRLQASHAPLQAESQHTPSTHWLPRHCSARVQEAPALRRGTQVPFWHQEFESHPAEFSQRVGQVLWPPLQTYGPQDGSPAVPTGVGTQEPALPARLHTSQALEQEDWQHTPSTQKPLAHSRLATQAVPRGRAAWHWPLKQRASCWHWSSFWQVVWQPLAPQS